MFSFSVIRRGGATSRLVVVVGPVLGDRVNSCSRCVLEIIAKPGYPQGITDGRARQDQMPDLDGTTSQPLDIGRRKEWYKLEGNLTHIEDSNKSTRVPNPQLDRIFEGYLAILSSATTPLVTNGRQSFV